MPRPMQIDTTKRSRAMSKIGSGVYRVDQEAAMIRVRTHNLLAAALPRRNEVGQI
jgi:hypothetical protein